MSPWLLMRYSRSRQQLHSISTLELLYAPVISLYQGSTSVPNRGICRGIQGMEWVLCPLGREIVQRFFQMQ